MSITYELAKELKEKGFLQRDKHYCPMEQCFDDCCKPSLSELIEACGDKFEVMAHYGWGWNAGSMNHDGGVDQQEVYGLGSTPEESVARLWLSLNKK